VSLRSDPYEHPVAFDVTTGKKLSAVANYWGLPNGSLTAVSTGKRSRLRYEELRGSWWLNSAILDIIFDNKYPRWRVNVKHKAKAERLRKIIYAYFNLRMSTTSVAELVSGTPASVRKMIDRAARDAKAIMLNDELKYQPTRHSAGKSLAPGRLCDPAETVVHDAELMTKDFARILSLAELPSSEENRKVKTQAGSALHEFVETSHELDKLVEFLKTWNERKPLVFITEKKYFYGNNTL
jgi:hypothetical protein